MTEESLRNNETRGNFMATKQSTIEFILDQLASAGEITARKMFGEYALVF